MKEKIKKAGAVFAASLMMLLASFSAPHIHNSYLRYEVGTSTVKVLISEQGGGGSGFAIKAASGEHYIATNKHVCEASENGWVKVVSDSGLSAWKRIVYKDNKHDICLVQGDKRLDPLELAGSPSVGDYHYIVGHPGLRPLTVSSGEYVGMAEVILPDFSIEEKEKCNGEIYELNPLEQMFIGREWVCLNSFYSYSSSAVAYGGNSGSPVVNKYGNVIGILFAGPRDQEHVSFIVPGYELKRVLEKF